LPLRAVADQEESVKARDIITTVALAVGGVGAVIGLVLTGSEDFDTFRAGTVLMVMGISLLFGGVIYRMASDDPENRWQLRSSGGDQPTPET